MKKLGLFVFIILLTPLFFVYSEEVPRKAYVVSVDGESLFKANKESSWQALAAGQELTDGAVIKTGKSSTVVLDVNGGGKTATLDIDPESELLLSQLLENKANNTQTTLLDLSLGKILVKAKKLHTKDSKFEVKTPTSVVGIRGTVFSVEVEAVEE